VSDPGSVTVWIDGERCDAVDGESVAAVLVARGVWALSRNPVTGAPRGPYCGMGVCFDCLVRLDGRPGMRACMARAREGLRIETAARAA
jgi:predicted molibdopterin-dependent oxidoreductase YjgC